MIPEALSDAEMILHTIICFRRTMRWGDRRKFIVDGHTLRRTDLAELLKYAVLPYHKDIPKPRRIDIFTQELARLSAEPRRIGNQCIRLAAETGNNAQNAMEPGYGGQEESDADGLAVE